MGQSKIDPQLLRPALATFATGVTIITAADPSGRPVGLTVNSFNSVSLEPPLVLWSLALDSRYLPMFRSAGTWAVHVLSDDQEQLSTRFASSRRSDKFTGVPYERGPDGTPLLPGCSARFICVTTFEYEGGDHAIFVGEVVDLETSERPPLIFHGGRYGRVLSSPRVPPDLPPGDDGEFGRHFIGHMIGRIYHAASRDVRREYRSRGLRGTDYTLLVSLGLGEGVPLGALRQRAQHGGGHISDEAVQRAVIRGDVVLGSGVIRLTSQGCRLLTELLAVMQASQLRMQSRLSPDEYGMLMDLLDKLDDNLAEDPNRGPSYACHA